MIISGFYSHTVSQHKVFTAPHFPPKSQLPHTSLHYQLRSSSFPFVQTHHQLQQYGTDYVDFLAISDKHPRHTITLQNGLLFICRHISQIIPPHTKKGSRDTSHCLLAWIPYEKVPFSRSQQPWDVWVVLRATPSKFKLTAITIYNYDSQSNAEWAWQIVIKFWVPETNQSEKYNNHVNVSNGGPPNNDSADYIHTTPNHHLGTTECPVLRSQIKAI